MVQTDQQILNTYRTNESYRLSVVQAVAQLLPLLQGSHGQLQVLFQTLDLSFSPAFHPTQFLVDLDVSLTGQPFLLPTVTKPCLISVYASYILFFFILL